MSILKRRNKRRQECRPIGNPVQENTLIRRMRTLPNSSQTVERRYPQRCREIAVGTATRTGFFHLHSQLAPKGLSLVKQRSNSRSPLHRRTIQSARNRNGTPLVDRLQRPELLIQSG